MSDPRDLWGKAVSRDPRVHSGDLVFAKTRVPVETLFAILREGGTVEEFQEGYPSVERWQVEAVLQVPPAPPRPSLALRQHIQQVHEILKEGMATSAWVIGSVARGEDEPGSDLDLLLDLAADASLIDLSGIRIDLMELLGVGVDVPMIDALKEPMRSRILNEAVPLDEWVTEDREDAGEGVDR